MLIMWIEIQSKDSSLRFVYMLSWEEKYRIILFWLFSCFTVFWIVSFRWWILVALLIFLFLSFCNHHNFFLRYWYPIIDPICICVRARACVCIYMFVRVFLCLHMCIYVFVCVCPHDVLNRPIYFILTNGRCKKFIQVTGHPAHIQSERTICK